MKKNLWNLEAKLRNSKNIRLHSLGVALFFLITRHGTVIEPNWKRAVFKYLRRVV